MTNENNPNTQNSSLFTTGSVTLLLRFFFCIVTRGIDGHAIFLKWKEPNVVPLSLRCIFFRVIPYWNVYSDSSYEDYEDGPVPKVRKIRSTKAAITSPSSTLSSTKARSRKGGMDTSEPHSSGKGKNHQGSAVYKAYNPGD
ncbi:uncharacterized protein [Nicotiana tomentosiformis]|uniref:uncharacterized protein n=1 Tax=Nicotiana tomentosiformis TaxID=4098 RepID=UPI00051C8186|nr:uncharacterized protein LOC104121428 [Nicotiana tomentosiformis]